MLDPHDILRVREHLTKRREKAKHDAFMRDKRTDILQVLAANLPRQDNMKKRSETIGDIADKLIELFEEYYV